METPRELIEEHLQGRMTVEKFMEGVVEEFQLAEKDIAERRFGVVAMLASRCLRLQHEMKCEMRLQPVGCKDGLIYYLLRG